MAKLLIYRGLPGSGKTWDARMWVAKDRARRARVNRDDLRSMMDDGEHVPGITEARIIAARDALILGLLGRGISAVCDDTNLSRHHVEDLTALAVRAGADFEVRNKFDVPIELCIERDAKRAGRARVGEDVIRDMHRRYLATMRPVTP